MGAPLFIVLFAGTPLSCSYAIMQTESGKAVHPMKMERLIGILSILLQREKVTAPELAEQFEVSHRSIQRNIKFQRRVGIPTTVTATSLPLL